MYADLLLIKKTFKNLFFPFIAKVLLQSCSPKRWNANLKKGEIRQHTLCKQMLYIIFRLKHGLTDRKNYNN